MSENETPKEPAQDLDTENLDDVVGGAPATGGAGVQEQDKKRSEHFNK